MRRRWTWTMAVLAALVRPSGAQIVDPHAALPERPSVATHAATVARGWLEVEAGIERPYDDGRFGDTGVPIAVKIGLASRAQLAIAPWISRPSGGSLSFDAIGAGVKYRLADHAPIVGAIAVLPSVSVPTGSARATDEHAAGILLISSRTIGAVSLDLNAGYTRRGGDGSLVPRQQSLWAVAAGGLLTHHLGWMGEVSGSPHTTGPAGRGRVINAIVGVNAALRPSIVIDIAAVAPLAGDDSFTVLSGAVWNVGKLWGRTSSGQKAMGTRQR